MKDFFKQFGGKATASLISEYEKSDRWIKGKFRNLERTRLDISPIKLPQIIYKQLATLRSRRPKDLLPVQRFDAHAFMSDADCAKMIWYGHSAIMLRMGGKTILIDPMLGPDTTPIAPIANRRFSGGVLGMIDDFPEIDLICITHDHYDHLDYASIQKLKAKTKQYYVALGLKRHLVAWGVDPPLVTEFEWYDQHTFGPLQITFTPTRHFSGRGISDRMMCLWGGWVLQSNNEKIWFSGDGGYGNHFKEIGTRLGPFDFAMMECGQYNEDWRPVHLFPDEAIQAALDAKAKKIMPVHWGGFDLSYQHKWHEPPSEFVTHAKENGIEYALPKLGEIFTIRDECQDMWWDSLL